MVLSAWSIGTIIGPVVGGTLVEHASWRWCFHINYPFCGIGFVVAILFVRLNAVSELTVAQKLRRVDWVGAALFIGSMTSFLVGISWGGVEHPWNSAATLAPILVGLLGGAVFFAWQLYKKEHTLLPMSIFNNWSALAAFYGALINGLVVSWSLGSRKFLLMFPALRGVVLLAVLLNERPRRVFSTSGY
jgi:MFS family permease